METSRAVVGSSAMRSSGFARERERDHHPLAHSARELVRVVAEPDPRLLDADLVEKVDRPLPPPPIR